MPSEPITVDTVRSALEGLLDPETGRSILQLNQLHDVSVDGSAVRVKLGLTTYSGPLWEETRESAEQALKGALPPETTIDVQIEKHSRPVEPLGSIGLKAKSAIAVGSGKGGVGKSTIATAIAYGLSRSGASVGLMDADVYGPSIPHLLGIGEERPATDGNRLRPIVVDDVKAMSIGLLVPAEEAVMWRGPMLHRAITQFLQDTEWGELDYMVIDMPPGTGDVALSLSQLLPLTGAVVVCTPQDVALLDAVKAITMFGKVNIPMLGIVENMSCFVCPDNGKRYPIFGEGGARNKAEQLGVPFLGEVPIQIPIRQRGDSGDSADNFGDPEAAPFFERICYNLVKGIATNRAAEPPMPSLTVL